MSLASILGVITFICNPSFRSDIKYLPLMGFLKLNCGVGLEI